MKASGARSREGSIRPPPRAFCRCLGARGMALRGGHGAGFLHAEASSEPAGIFLK